MVSIVAIMVTSFIIMTVGGGLGYLIYLKTRPKKETWIAKVYQLGKGVKPPVENEKGEIISDLRLNDLIPYSKDFIEKIEKEHGVIVYRLQKMNLAVPAIKSSVVEFWGKDQSEVHCLSHDGEIALLEKGYDNKTGKEIFHPIGQTKMNMITSNIAIRKDRLTSTKDVLSAITPWIVAGICMLALVSISYFSMSGFVKVSDNLEGAAKISAENIIEVEKIRTGVTPEQHNLAIKTDEPKIPFVDGNS